MRRFGSCAGLLCLLSATLAFAQGDGMKRMRVKVGGHVDLTVVTVQIQCDDLSIVKVDAIDKVLRVTGRKEGKTLCSFWHSTAHRSVYEITVAP